MQTSRLILVGGGSRSGKSRYAVELARAAGSRLAFIATAQARDEEMRRRIDAHRAERGARFTTFEEPFAVARLLREQQDSFDAVIVDCLTLWVSNLLLAGEAENIAERAEELAAAASASPARVIVVSNEVGCGIVPENELARRFRDEAGRVNQIAARHAAEVYWMVFGVPVKVK